MPPRLYFQIQGARSKNEKDRGGQYEFSGGNEKSVAIVVFEIFDLRDEHFCCFGRLEVADWGGGFALCLERQWSIVLRQLTDNCSIVTRQ